MFVRQTLGVSCIAVDIIGSTYCQMRASSLGHRPDATVEIVFVLNYT